MLTVGDPTELTDTDRHPCQQPDCPQEGIACWLNGGSTEPDEWWCYEHMTAEGYCWGCGYFQAGTEAFDFGTSGLCAECQANPDITGDADEDEDWNYPDDDLGFDPMFLL